MSKTHGFFAMALMNNYSIALDGRNFEIVETQPDGRVSFIGPFRSEEDARLCIDDHIEHNDMLEADRRSDW